MSDSRQQLIEEFRKAFKAGGAGQSNRQPELASSGRNRAPEVVAQDLRALLARFREPHQFQAGDIVSWKDGMRNKTVPDYGSVAIVVEVLEEPLLVLTESSGSPYFRERLDLVIGLIDQDDGDFTVFHVDSSRFKPYHPA